MLRSHTLMLDNTLIPAYQERVTSLTFNTEHTSEQFDDDDDDDDDEQSLVMLGVTRGAGKRDRIIRNMDKSEHLECSVLMI
jgi:hypothetical protein